MEKLVIPGSRQVIGRDVPTTYVRPVDRILRMCIPVHDTMDDILGDLERLSIEVYAYEAAGFEVNLGGVDADSKEAAKVMRLLNTWWRRSKPSQKDIDDRTINVAGV